MRKGIDWTIAGILFVSTALTPGACAAVPDWARQAAAQSLPSYPADTKAVVLFDGATYTIVGQVKLLNCIAVS